MRNYELARKAMVVTRQLHPSLPVIPSIIIVVSEEYSDKADVDFNVEAWLHSKAEEHIAEFKKKFVEFKLADWETHIVDTISD